MQQLKIFRKISYEELHALVDDHGAAHELQPLHPMGIGKESVPNANAVEKVKLPREEAREPTQAKIRKVQALADKSLVKEGVVKL